MFQYRKRYGLHAILKAITNHNRIKRFNTASGMDCMQYRHYVVFAELRRFQYRKRYGLHAIQKGMSFVEKKKLFQYRKRYGLHAITEQIIAVLRVLVSIPQAVWIACNNEKCIHVREKHWFQYRKRYGLHAIECTSSSTSTCSNVSIPQAVWIACNEEKSKVAL